MIHVDLQDLPLNEIAHSPLHHKLQTTASVSMETKALSTININKSYK